MPRTRYELPVLALIALCGLANPSNAQTRLDNPITVLPRGFEILGPVRELADGRVLVADPGSRQLLVLDVEMATFTEVGSPDEFKDPDGVLPMPGDSTLLVDLGKARLTIVTPDFSSGRSIPINQGGGIMSGEPPLFAIPGATDSEGRFYFLSPDQEQSARFPTGSLLRFPPEGGSPDTVATLRVREVDIRVDGGMQIFEPKPLSPADAWGVASDGSIVIARVEDYHLERMAPNGEVEAGEPLTFNPIPVRPVERETLLAENARSPGGLMVRAEMTSDGLNLVLSRGKSGENLPTDPAAWPEVHPPFFGGTLQIDQQDRTWIRRHVATGEPSTYDVFDLHGSPMGTVTLERGKSILAFGSQVIYVSALGEDGLRYLEVYSLPRL